ncbi:hypothetical protein [Sphingopyxis alaskensis]|jgi:hypothetical protein|uniref:Lipoprotein n=1 Tax=Sphingopyxis alaskensis (strain DSM 13593 / LMG 18877 / RB2256) TaxID=317655 RepID=Q1GTV3_SPHAL|nr:hypothetical protein [Sphingopyxis alaskensis]ABF52919.1 hypothetical protein Sala_1203 [Sphingopyxis alaskensis RB2256]MCM3419626.1 hypothetical protein [Sphingopyxis alaskensis]
MHKSLTMAAASAAMLLTGCEKAEAPAPAETTTTETFPVDTVPAEEVDATAPHRFASWTGKWTGVEGMYATITPAGPGQYKLEMQSDLDTRGTYDGTDSEHGIQFTRGGEDLTLRRASGDETGLKYLAGKTECLIVKPGEGYCRD